MKLTGTDKKDHILSQADALIKNRMKGTISKFSTIRKEIKEVTTVPIY